MIVVMTSETGGVFRCPISKSTISGIAKVFGKRGAFYLLSGVVVSGEIQFNRASVIKNPGHYILIVYSVLDDNSIQAENINDLIVVRDEV